MFCVVLLISILYFYFCFVLYYFFFFFFKQKTAYEISACLVGSEMCIRDRHSMRSDDGAQSRICQLHRSIGGVTGSKALQLRQSIHIPVSYTHLTLPTNR